MIYTIIHQKKLKQNSILKVEGKTFMKKNLKIIKKFMRYLIIMKKLDF